MFSKHDLKFAEWLSRGGYGCPHLLEPEDINLEMITNTLKGRSPADVFEEELNGDLLLMYKFLWPMCNSMKSIEYHNLKEIYKKLGLTGREEKYWDSTINIFGYSISVSYKKDELVTLRIYKDAEGINTEHLNLNSDDKFLYVRDFQFPECGVYPVVITDNGSYRRDAHDIRLCITITVPYVTEKQYSTWNQEFKVSNDTIVIEDGKEVRVTGRDVVTDMQLHDGWWQCGVTQTFRKVFG